MDISTISNIVLSTLSFVLAVISIVLVRITLVQNNKILAQNNKMIEEANRPYITISFDAITTSNRNNYFVIKNYGNSAGHILQFQYPDELKTSEQGNHLYNEQFDAVIGMTLFPGQAKLLPWNIVKFTKPVDFEIVYRSNFSKKEYSECVSIDAEKLNHIPICRPPKTKTPEEFQNGLICAIYDLIEKHI